MKLTIFKQHFPPFEEDFYDTYAEQYGQFRLHRIQQAVTRFIDCGDYTKGIAWIKCTNKECNQGRSRMSCSSRHKDILENDLYEKIVDVVNKLIEANSKNEVGTRLNITNI